MAAEIFNELPRATNANGVPIDGAQWFFYASGTTTPQAVYSNATLVTSLGATVTANSGGQFAPIYFNAKLSYRGVLKTPSGSTLRDIDPINPGVLAELSATTGASLIGAATGGTVEDAIWHKGRVTAIAGSKMAIRWLRDSAAFPLEDEASIWAGKVATDHGISATFTSADGQAGSPSNGLFVMANNNGCAGDVVAGMFDAVARANNAAVFGANIIARGTGKAGCKFVGLEIDVEPSAGDISINSASAGLYINIFNQAISGPAIQTGSVGGGTFAAALIVGGLSAAGVGVALQSSAQASALIDTTAGTYNDVAIRLGNNQARGIRLSGTASAHAFIYNDSLNNVRNVLGSGSWIWRNNANTASLASIADSAGQAVFNLETSAGEYRVNGTKVVGARGSAITAPTGGATIDAEARTAIGTIIARLQAHGLIT